jgi:hypothetical protein
MNQRPQAVETVQAVETDDDREMYAAATLLSEDPDECDIEYAFAVQAEVILREE